MRCNRISFFLLIILISTIVISCKSKIIPRSNATDVGPTPVPIHLKPLTATWRIANESLIQQESSSIAIEAIYLNGQETILFFTLSGIDFEEFTPGIPIQITDDIGHSSKLLKVLPLGIVDSLSVGMMVFEPRRVGAQKLILRWSIVENEEASEIHVATFSGKASEDIADRTYYSSHDSSVKQDSYRISISWGFKHNNQKEEVPAEVASPEAPASGAQPTSTPANQQPLADLASGESIMQEFSFVIEDTAKEQIKTINVQLLTDANAIVLSDVGVSVPGPIIINESIPTPVPSAYP